MVQAEEDGEGALPKGFLSEVFGGQLSSRVACEVCHHTSITLEPFMDLSLPIPADTLADMEDSTPDRYTACHLLDLVEPVQCQECLVLLLNMLAASEGEQDVWCFAAHGGRCKASPLQLQVRPLRQFAASVCCTLYTDAR